MMIHPLGYWWRRRAAERRAARREMARREIPVVVVPDIPGIIAVAPEPTTEQTPRAWSSAELRGRYRRVLAMRESGLKFREIAGYIRTGNRPVTAQRARQIYVFALNARERGII